MGGDTHGRTPNSATRDHFSMRAGGATRGWSARLDGILAPNICIHALVGEDTRYTAGNARQCPRFMFHLNSRLSHDTEREGLPEAGWY